MVVSLSNSEVSRTMHRAQVVWITHFQQVPSNLQLHDAAVSDIVSSTPQQIYIKDREYKTLLIACLACA